MKKLISFAILLLSFNAFASVEFASFLYFKGCWVPENICNQAIYEIPNIEIELSNGDGIFSRTQEQFGKTFNEKTEYYNEGDNTLIRISVTDESGTFVIKPTEVKVVGSIDNLKNTQFEGEKIWLTENNYITPIFYVSKKWNVEPIPFSNH
jgi:hypothetical protein